MGIYLALFNTTETFLDGASIWLLSAVFFCFAAAFSLSSRGNWVDMRCLVLLRVLLGFL